MVGSSVKSSRAPSSKAASTSRPFQYRRPWNCFFPTVVLFLLLNYLSFGTEVNAAGDGLVLPSYVQAAAVKRKEALEALASGQPGARPAPFHFFLFIEQDVMGAMFYLGRLLFRGMRGIQGVCIGAWIIHAFEVGACLRVCLAHRAPILTTLRYVVATALSGFAQLMPLFAEQKEHMMRTQKGHTRKEVSR